ncbi:MAG: hypothetical protein FH761_06765 [Firmicutes bacterium]|nr:hypothetical protein [Bacillota bacterium]
MLFSKFLEQRKSIREYKEKQVERNALIALENYTIKINEKIGPDVKLVLIEDGKEFYGNLKGKGGYAGVMIKSPHYLGIMINSENNDKVVDIGYHVEDIITKASELGLGSCWIDLNNVSDDIKDYFRAEFNGTLNFAISLGYSNENKHLEPISTSSRLAIEDIVYLDKWDNKIKIEDLEKVGLDKLFYYVRYAPSSLNRQPWRFILKKDRVILTLLKPYSKETLVDAGIMMYYFEKMINNIGFKGVWNKHIIVDSSQNDYITIGEFKI